MTKPELLFPLMKSGIASWPRGRKVAYCRKKSVGRKWLLPRVWFACSRVATPAYCTQNRNRKKLFIGPIKSRPRIYALYNTNKFRNEYFASLRALRRSAFFFFIFIQFLYKLKIFVINGFETNQNFTYFSNHFYFAYWF